MRRSHRLALLTLLSLTAAAGVPRVAHAFPWFFDFGGGIASASKTDPILSSTPSSLESGFAGMFTLGAYLQEGQQGLLFSLGAQQRYLSGTTLNGNSQVLPTYALFRVELWRLMLGAGYSAWVWQDPSFKKHPGASAYLAEATLLFPITIEIDFALQGAAQYFQDGSGNKGPTPSYEGLALFRLNYGLSESSKTARRKYKGWRYPFGNPMN